MVTRLRSRATEVGPPPQIGEDDVVGELRELRRDGSQVIGHGSGPSRVRGGNRKTRSAGAQRRVSTFRAVYT